MNHKHFLLAITTILAFQTIQSQDLTEEELKTWWQKDLEQDSIPGVGLERVYRELIKDKKGEEVVVAVLDTKIDMLHEDFQGIFWVNTGEIPFNGIDDDNNGYIDDTNGWNFMGNKKNEDLSGQFLEPTRIVNRLKQKYEGVNQSEIPKKDKEEYQIFITASKQADKKLNEVKDIIKSADSIYAIYYRAKDSVNSLLKDKKYTYKTVDSLRTKLPDLEADFRILSLVLQQGYTDQDIKDEQDYFSG